jgi:ABC-type nickel/cobalt efflux system permease component RcnA
MRRSALARPRRFLLAALLVLAVSALAAPGAMAHPLGNFSVNHLAKVKVSSDRVEIRYLLDQAEIPTFQEREKSRAEVLAAKRAEVSRGLSLRVDGRELPLEALPGAKLTMPVGQGGLRTTRLELSLSAVVDDPSRVEVRDETFSGRAGWKAIVAEAGDGTAVRSSAPSGDPTAGLRRYPEDLLRSPLDRRSAVFRVEPGDGTLAAPRAEGGEYATTRAGGGGFASLFEDAASGEGVLLVLLLAAFGWGALHALSPGHGKAMVAAYLVGTRGTARHAVALGATVTVTHTIGVFALGLVTLALSQYVLPEDLYPWLTLVSGLLVVTVGAAVLRSRFRSGRDAHARSGAHPHAHAHSHPHAHPHSHPHAHPHSHPPSDPPSKQLGWKGLLGMGVAAGLIPCPSALVVLLAAISQHEVALGLLLIVAFSLGLAGTLTVLGLAVVSARRVIPSRLATGRLATALPAVSALVIVGVGCLLTARAVPGVV